MTKLKLLYYSKALGSNHGGRLHSEAFVREAQRNNRIESFEFFPLNKAPITDGNNISSCSIIKKIKRNPLFLIFNFLRINYLSYKEIFPIIKELKPNAIHFRITRNFLIIRVLRKKFPKLIISTEVNASPFDESFKNIAFKRFFRKLEKKSLQKADANFFVSSYLKENILQESSGERDYVVHNGVDLDLFIEKPREIKEEVNPIKFGYIGTLDFHKNLEILIDAFKILLEANVKAKLILVGDGPMMTDLKNYVNQKKLRSNVEFKGWVDHKKIPAILNKEFDVAIHHSANPYMSPLKIFEYMAAGLPVIGPDIPSIREVFINEEDIFLVDTIPQDIADKMVFLANNPIFRRKIGRNGLLKVRKNYGWSHNADKILKILSEKLPNRSS